MGLGVEQLPLPNRTSQASVFPPREDESQDSVISVQGMREPEPGSKRSDFFSDLFQQTLYTTWSSLKKLKPGIWLSYFYEVS